MAQKERRQLEPDEKKLILRNLEELKEARAYTQYLLHDAELKINEGLYQNFVYQRKQYRLKKKQIAADLTDMDKHILLLQDQLENGVLPKEQIENGVEGGKDGGRDNTGSD